MEIQPKQPTAQGPAETFTGDVWFDMIAAGDPPSDCASVSSGSLPARTPPGTHANGQTLHITEGRGFVQARGGPVIEVRPGDTIYTPPGEWHWHGATPDHFMTHLAMSEDLAENQHGPVTEWGAHLSELEYPGHRHHPRGRNLHV